jgi:hypothetical protein
MAGIRIARTYRSRLTGKKNILPIWHNITHEQVLKFSPPLADKLAVRSDESTALEIATEIIKVVRPDIFTRILRRVAHFQIMEASKTEAIPISKLKHGPIVHETLPDNLVSRIRLIRASLLDVFPHSMKWWIDGFKRDSHPSDEITHWEHVAAVFIEYVIMTPSLSLPQRCSVFTIVSSLWMDLSSSELSELAATLPKGAVRVLKELYQYIEPIYDFDEDIPYSKNGGAKRKAKYDTEHFPIDLPDELVREIMKFKSFEDFAKYVEI